MKTFVLFMFNFRNQNYILYLNKYKMNHKQLFVNNNTIYLQFFMFKFKN